MHDDGHGRLARRTVEAPTCPHIDHELATFARDVGRHHAGSFYVHASLGRGQRAPSGFRTRTFKIEVDRDTAPTEPTPAPDISPWGLVDHATPHGEHIWFVSTPSHGGFFVAPHLRAKIPAEHRAYAARWSHGWGEGWFEEDCAAAAVLLAFPDLFEPAQVEAARAMAPEYFGRAA